MLQSRNSKDLISSYIDNDLIPSMEKTNMNFIVSDPKKREMKRHIHVISSYKNDDIENVSTRFCDSRNVRYSIEYATFGETISNYITPQYFHSVGKFSFGSSSSNTITLGCEFFGKFEYQMRDTLDLLDESKKLLLDIRFNKNHFNTLIPKIWKITPRDIGNCEYSIHLYQDIDNNLYFQLTSKNGHLVGVLNPLKGKCEANFFKNRLQVSYEEIKRINKLQFFYSNIH